MPDSPVVVGAGAAGLAVAASLGRRGVDAVVLERSLAVGSAWATRYDSLQLHTIRWLSGLPGYPIPRAFGRWVARDDVVAYLADYAARFDVRPEFGVQVSRLDRDGDSWVLQTSQGERRAPAVVLATGYSRSPHLPPWADSSARSGSPGPTVLHSSQYRNPDGFVGRHVLVVGAGNSAAEIAVDLARAGAQVSVSVRTPPNIVRRDTLGVPSQLLGIALRRVPERVMNPLSAVLRKVSVPDLSEHGLPAPAGDGFTQFLRTRTVPILDHGFVQELRAGRIRVVADVHAVTGEAVELVDGSRLRPAAVVCATGFRPGLDSVVGHLGVLDDRGAPLVHGDRTLPSAPGLYFAGISVQLAGLLREIGREAGRIGDQLAGAQGPGAQRGRPRPAFAARPGRGRQAAGRAW